MIDRVRRRLQRDEGFSLVEVTVALVLSSMISAILVSVFYSFSQNTGDLVEKSNVQAEARAVIAEQVVRIRQAIKADANGEAIEYLNAGALAFYTQNYESAEIERVVYERKNCVGDECELWVYRYALESTDGITAEFFEDPYESSFLMGQVLNDIPLFEGVVYGGDPLARSTVSSCDGGGSPCDFIVVGITLRARPYPTSGGAATPIELHEEVRVRSA